MNLLESFTCLYQKLCTSGSAISSHGFAGPLKCKTAAASNIYLSICGDLWPNSAICHEDSMHCICPSNASNAGGSTPGCHNVNPALRFCKTRWEGLKNHVNESVHSRLSAHKMLKLIAIVRQNWDPYKDLGRKDAGGWLVQSQTLWFFWRLLLLLFLILHTHMKHATMQNKASLFKHII